MLTKKQKAKQIEEGRKLLKENKSLVFIDFSGADVEKLKSLRKILKNFGAKLKIVKKRLMRIAFEREGIDFNPEQFESQLGVIFINKDFLDVINPIYKFFKEKGAGAERDGFRILGAYDLSTKNFTDAETIIRIGQLPAKEVLLSQLLGVLSAPIKMFLYILSEKSKMVEK